VFHPSDFRVVTASRDKTVRVWDVRGKVVPELADPLRPFSLEVTSADKSKFFTINRLGDVGVIWIRDKQTPIYLRGHKPGILTGAFSLDGALVATAGMDRSARVWEAATGKHLAICEGHADAVRCVAFSPDGKRLATGSHDTTARVWDTVTGRSLSELRGHTNTIIRVTWTPDGSRVITNGLDRTIRVWEPNSGAELLVLSGLIELAFAPDGSGIVAMRSGGRQEYELIYDSRPVNRVFSRMPIAPPPRLKP
jgi:WD40 repeat protein